MQLDVNIKLDVDATLKLIERFDDVFNPHLSDEVNIKEYANKLSVNGIFVLAHLGQTAHGLIAYYLNKQEKYVYIPLLAVSEEFQHQGLGTLMLEKLVDSLHNEYNHIMLEVFKENSRAHKFYLRNGFYDAEYREKKILMTKDI